MTYASKTTFCLKNLKILRPKVTKILRICLKNFCEFSHWSRLFLDGHISTVTNALLLLLYTLQTFKKSMKILILYDSYNKLPNYFCQKTHRYYEREEILLIRNGCLFGFSIPTYSQTGL